MAGVATEESGVGRSFEGVSSGHQQLRRQSEEALGEWRSSEQVENGTPSTSPPYWDSDDDEDGGPKPSDLYGKYTWKIDKFSQINKRELRSNAFEVGNYKWYILIYPQGCDVCNHLSLFLCVANHDKLLPGWSHFAQFTIAVVNKDPKKSKYSDTLHRFWKKEHDWGWKKFMELPKVFEGFIDADTLVIKAQVQVIRERVDRPFHCLGCQYRRELIRVYLSNVELIFRRYVEERRSKLGKLIDDKARWSSIRAFWLGMDRSSKQVMSQEKSESILKVIVKHFFLEKEVTSTLVMDSLYSGMKALEGQNKGKKNKGKYLENEELPIPIIRNEKDRFVLAGDVLSLLERAATESLPPKDEKAPQNRTKEGATGEEFSKDSIERDERRLTELGRRTIEISVFTHIFCKIEVAYQEAVSLKRQEELIREEEAAWLAEVEQKGRRGISDKEKKSKRKQGKQKKNNRKGKDKGRDGKLGIIIAQDRIDQDFPTVEREESLVVETEMIHENSEIVEEDISDISDSIDCEPEILPLDSEGREVSPVNWDTDSSEVHPPTEASSSEISALSGILNGVESINLSAVDDSSSTCSSESIPPVFITAPQQVNSRCHYKYQKSPNRWKTQQSEVTSDVHEESSQPSEALTDVGCSKDASRSSKAVIRNEPRVEKEEGIGSTHRVFAFSSDTGTSVTSPPRSPSKKIPSAASPKLESKVNAIGVKNPSTNGPKQADRSNEAENVATSKLEAQRVTTPKPTENSSRQQVISGTEKPPAHHVPAITDKLSVPSMPIMSRPLSAPLAPTSRPPPVSMVSSVGQTAPTLARSVSATGRLGPEQPTPSYVPQSYRNAITGNHGISSPYPQIPQNHSVSSGLNSSFAYSHASAPLFSSQNTDRMDPNTFNPNFAFGMVNQQHGMLHSGRVPTEQVQRDNSWNFIRDHNTPINDIRFDLYHPRPENHLPSQVVPGTSGRQSNVLGDEFPHIGIINELLDDENVIGNMGSGYPNFGNGHLNRQFSFPGDLASSTSLRGFERGGVYHDNEFQNGYGSSRSSYHMHGDMVSQQPYMNGNVDGLIPSQWQMAGAELQYPSIGNTHIDGYQYHHMTDYSNIATGINGYTMFRPSNGL